VVSLSPTSGQGSAATFALAVSDPGGAANLSTVQLIVGSSTSLASACAVTYLAQQNTFALTNDAGTAYQAYVTPGQATSISNTQCTLSGAGSSVQKAGNVLTMTVSLQFSLAFAGAGSGPAKNVYAKPVNASGQAPSAGTMLMGTWTVPQAASGPPAPVSVSPSSGKGLSQSFTLVVSDSAGAADLATVHLIVTGPQVLANACWLTYQASSGSFALVSDPASSYVGYISPGQAASLSNSQCTLNGVGSSVQTSGTLMTVTYNVTFKPAFASVGSGATKTLYAYPVNAAGKSPSSLVQMGTWTLQ
jgi:hypothetical protein